MKFTLPRTLFLICMLAWAILLWPNPVTIFLAASFSCLTLPVYRKLRIKSRAWQRSLKMGGANSRARNFLITMARHMPITAYTCFILGSIILPVAALVMLVSPQAVAGYARLRELRAANFEIPPHWMEYVNAARRWLEEYPRFNKAVNEGLANLDSMVSDAIGILVSRSFGFVGSTMTMFWLIFLFLTLTILFTVHAAWLRRLAWHILQVPSRLIGNFIDAIHKALKAIMLGIVFVALVQGALCGIGFAVAGVNQPAFWGMLATVVAPIPAVGTALVWLPLCISLWFTGKTMAAVGLALWGGIFISGVDNVLRPFFLRQGIHASFFVLILSILCGMSVFGAVGLIAGPILLAIAVQAYQEGMHYSILKKNR